MTLVVVRTSTVERLTAEHSDELLTTGEAAKLLSSSRQHVVDLCNSGDLPFLTMGRHRRVRRRDVEALRNRTERMTRDQRRSLWLNTAIAGHLVTDPDRVLGRARANLVRLQQTHPRGQASYWLTQWRDLLDGPIEQLVEVLTSPTPRARELRQNSPFSGVLAPAERQRLLDAFRDQQTRRS